MLNDKRIRIIIGHYGSGKTEFAVNYALKLAEMGKKTAIADLDIVNPYFRSREKYDELTEKGVWVMSNSLNGKSALDLPAISASVAAPLQKDDYDVVLDVGGDAVGARVLARYKEYFKKGEYDMFCILNANREQTSTVEGAIRHIDSIESVTGTKVTGLVNNTHMLRETTVEDVFRGQELSKRVSEELEIPIKYVCTLENVARLLPEKMDGEIFPIKLYMREIWM